MSEHCADCAYHMVTTLTIYTYSFASEYTYYHTYYYTYYEQATAPARVIYYFTYYYTHYEQVTVPSLQALGGRARVANTSGSSPHRKIQICQ